jgi:hypothetical protein
MRERDARVRTLRTTLDGVGRPYGIVTGMAATPDEALAELRRNADAQAESLETRKLAEMYQPSPRRAPAAQPEPTGPFEVVDVRLTAGVMDGGGDGWLAYGTLAKNERA